MSGVLMTVLSGVPMWSVGNFLTQMKTNSQGWVQAIIMMIGFAMLGFAAYKIAKGLISKKGDTNWIMVILLVVIGAMLIGGGWGGLDTLGNGTQEAIKKMGQSGGTIVWPFGL